MQSPSGLLQSQPLCLMLMASGGHLRRDAWVNKAALSVPCPINILQEPFVTTATPECPRPHGPIDQFCAVNSAELSITSPREETALSVASWFPPASHQPRGGADRWWEAEPYITVMKKQY